MYWSMLEVGLGFIAANLIVVYGLLANSSIGASLLSLRSLLSRSKASRVSSQEDDISLPTDKRRIWPTDTSQSLTYAEFAGRDTEEIPLDSRVIHSKHEFGSTIE